MASNKIKVVGYAQKVVFTDGIEYRNFTPDLVGLQLASTGGTPLFTMGNFSITSNLDSKLDKTYLSSKFSNFVTLADMNLTLTQAQTLLSNNAEVVLNLDRSNLGFYALFGSLNEYIRVALEDIITNWPASLYLYPIGQTPTGQAISGYTFDNYTYDNINDVSNFRINTTFINNKFQLNYTRNGSIQNTFNSSNDLRNFTTNFASYAVLFNDTEFPVIGYSASTYQIMDYAYLSVQGNPFSGVSQTSSYHIKPNKVLEETFFNSLPDLEAFLLNRNVIPAYTATFKYPVKSETGLILYISNTLTWPVSDGYNIDFNTTGYEDYATSLSDIAASNDSVSSNLMGRFLVSESITSFDTSPVYFSAQDQDTSGQKVNKLLQVYGGEYDEINRYITGIEFANTVTYDKENNTPDIYLKNLARVLGWELISSVIENDLLASYVTTNPVTYSGHSVGLTAVEADTELWRRLILNTPWIWKSKGARKSVEFLLKFIGAPKGLFKFNEYIYKAAGPIDVDLFQQILVLNGLSDDITTYPIDGQGYPRPLPNTPDMYFQGNGLWYRETGGTGSTIDLLYGNNPHVGPYDGGAAYMNQFRCLIPDFSAVTVSSTTVTTNSENLYTNYGMGEFDFDTSTATTVDTVQIIDENGLNLSNCVVFTPSIQPNPNPAPELNDCGCDSPNGNNVMSLCIDGTTPTSGRTATCDNIAAVEFDSTTGLVIFQKYQHYPDGNVINIPNTTTPMLNTTNFGTQACCSMLGGTPHLYNEVVNGTQISTGYVCCYQGGNCGCTIACQWTANITPIELPLLSLSYSGAQLPYLQFTQPNGEASVVTPDGCNCIRNFTVAVPNVVDPYTGQVGYGCQLTFRGISDLASGQNGVIANFYAARSQNKIGCKP